MPKVPGMYSSESSEQSADKQSASAADGQESIVKSFSSTLDLIILANNMVADAITGKKKADGERAKANKSTIGLSQMKEKQEAAEDADKRAKEAMKNAGELSDEAKKDFAKAMIPMGKATYQMTQLSKEASKWFKGASAEMKSAGPMGAVKLKKKLESGIFVAKSTPEILKEWGGTSKQIIEFAKKQGVSTKGADGDMEIQG